MVDKAKLIERLMATFLDELSGHVASMNDDLLSLEKSASAGNQLSEEDSSERMPRLFRAAHSLKGASRAVSQPEIEQVCHQLEEVFGGLRDDRLNRSTELFALMFRVVDAIETAGHHLRAREPVNSEELLTLVEPLELAANDEAFSVPIKQPEAADADAEANSEERDSPGFTSLTPADTADSKPKRSREPATEEVAKTRMQKRGLEGSVRVAETKLESLMAQAGEMLIARQRVEGRPDDLEELLELASEWKAEWSSIDRLIRSVVAQADHPLLSRSHRLAMRLAQIIESNGDRIRLLDKKLEAMRRKLVGDSRYLNQVGKSLQDDVLRIRMFPLKDACAGLERAVRDVARTGGKNVELVIQGGDTEVDRTVLEGLADPLMHLVRNAVDHGIESPEERKRLGKPDPARITVSAELRGAQVNIVVSDDGRGLDHERIREKAREKNLPTPSDEQDLVRLIFVPGFSTASKVTDVSGRGIGMDVVKAQIEMLHGTIDIASVPGLGTRFIMSVPLTLTTIPALFVQTGGLTCALPSTNVVRLVSFRPDELRRAGGRDVLPFGKTPLAVSPLTASLKLAGDPQPGSNGAFTGVVVTSGDRERIFVVDQVLNEQEAVVKGLGNRIQRLPHISGATLLRSGEIALVLNVSNLLRTRDERQLLRVTEQTPVEPDRQKRVLVVDDSLTTRTLLKSILETEEFDVVAAVDGQDGWERIRNDSFDLVVTDVDMPRMDGFQLTATIRESDSHSDLPVILVTSRGNDEDRRRGVEVGADAHLIKSDFEQTTILETVRRLL